MCVLNLLNTPLFVWNTYIFHDEKCWDATFARLLEMEIANIFSWQPGCKCMTGQYFGCSGVANWYPLVDNGYFGISSIFTVWLATLDTLYTES